MARRLVVSMLVAGCLVCVFLAAAEVVFLFAFRYLLPIDAYALFDEPQGMWPLGQNTKRGLLPRDYILLSGDSYAFGVGDWFERVKAPQPRIINMPAFGSAHLIHSMTGMDVIDYGFSGAGSVRGLVVDPIRSETYLRGVVLQRLMPPSWFVHYFYEGNDLYDNVNYHRYTVAPYFSAAPYDDPAEFSRYIDQVLARDHLMQAAAAPWWTRRLLFVRTVSRSVRRAITGSLDSTRFPNEYREPPVNVADWHPRPGTVTHNRARIAGTEVFLPDNLQGPGMNLTPEETETALAALSAALQYARRHFYEARFVVVYLPSVATVYDMVGDTVDLQNYDGRTRHEYPVAEAMAHSVWLRRMTGDLCRRQGVMFIDATDDLRAAAGRERIHGPEDWNHFNEIGYRALGESVVRAMSDLWPADGRRP